jgi:hypothetical protein
MWQNVTNASSVKSYGIQFVGSGIPACVGTEGAVLKGAQRARGCSSRRQSFTLQFASFSESHSVWHGFLYCSSKISEYLKYITATDISRNNVILATEHVFYSISCKPCIALTSKHKIGVRYQIVQSYG